MKRFLALVIGGLTLISCGQKEQPTKTEAEGAKGASTEAHRQNYIEEANVVELSLEGQQRAGIAVAPLSTGAVEAKVLLTGTVKPIDNRVSAIHPLSRGRITQVLCKIGDRVEKDQVLANFDNIEAGELSAQFSGAQAELRRLKIQLGNAERQAERTRSLYAIGAVPAKQAESTEADARALAEAINAQESVISGLSARLARFGASPNDGSLAANTKIRAPFSGIVIHSDSAPGAVVDTSTELFSIADLSRVYVEAQVFEKDLSKVHPGLATQLRLEAYPTEVFTGRIVAIRDILDPQTRTAGVRIELPNKDGKLRLEMFATVELPTVGTHTALTVPLEAVQTINKRQVVFVKQDALHFAAREVNPVGEGLTREIVAGLREGELVVVKGAYQLKSVFLSRQVQGEHEHD